MSNLAAEDHTANMNPSFLTTVQANAAGIMVWGEIFLTHFGLLVTN